MSKSLCFYKEHMGGVQKPYVSVGKQLETTMLYEKQFKNYEQPFRIGSIWIGFGWYGVQNKQEDMPHGPCHGPEAWNAPMDLVVVAVRKL
jgi:hypothetical protein